MIDTYADLDVNALHYVQELEKLINSIYDDPALAYVNRVGLLIGFCVAILKTFPEDKEIRKKIFEKLEENSFSIFN